MMMVLLFSLASGEKVHTAHYHKSNIGGSSAHIHFSLICVGLSHPSYVIFFTLGQRERKEKSIDNELFSLALKRLSWKERSAKVKYCHLF